MTEESVRLGVLWVLGVIPLALGAYIAFFNVFRHWEMRRLRKTGHTQYISGTPFAGSLFFFLGVWVAPLSFSAWMLLIFLTEGAALVTYVPEDSSSDEA